MMSFERFNKKCKGIVGNKRFPFRSLANAIVRDGAARFYRWKTKCTKSVPETQVQGKAEQIELPLGTARMIKLSCGCQTRNCSVYSHPQAVISGISFSSGEKNILPRRRCGSVVTTVIGGRSRYGLVKSFFRVVCRCTHVRDFVSVTLFPPPVYPDGDPLTVRVDIPRDVDYNNIDRVDVLSLNCIQPSRILVEIDSTNNCLYMMRIEGYDTLPY